MRIILFIFILIIINVQCITTKANATENFVTQEKIRETLSNVGKETTKDCTKKDHPIIGAAQEPLLIVSTVDGELIALTKYKGTIKWKMKDKPVIQTSVLKTPFSLPDPTDGSVYVFGPRSKDGAMDLMKKLSLNIPELVARAPTRSNIDNSICTGSKSAVWYVIDPDTGQKLEEISHERTITYCPMVSQLKRGLFIGRTEYKLVVMDTDTKDIKWNITYSDYNTHAYDEPKEYDLKHLTSSQDGLLVTLKSNTNEVLWTAELGSTVVAAYQLSWKDLALRRVPIFRFGGETLSHMLEQIGKSDDIFRSGTLLRSTLYVGTAHSGLYALPSITHDAVHIRSDDHRVSLLTSEHWSVRWSQAALVGHYKPLLGSSSDHQGRIGVDHRITDNSGQAGADRRPWSGHRGGDVSRPDDRRMRHSSLAWIGDWDGVTLVYIVAGLAAVVAILVAILKSLVKISEKLLRRLVDEALVKEKRLQLGQQQERHSDSSWSRQSTNTNGSGSLKPWSSDGPTAFVDEIDVHEGWFRVGKIQFDPAAALGHGCEGTIVYRGEYDKRRVAVKRILPECLTIADREVALLRESDEHLNVIRYFCTEQDSQFRYIALDYCDATLKEFAEHPRPEQFYCLTAREALFQASSGLGHLHQLEIVHRDVKPANVLLRKTAGPHYQVVISDFGLCKKLVPGRGSYSRQSGLRGTEGWIAPEIMREDAGRMTYAVDVFSLGCVFYYVLSRGDHPFGNGYSRQANILSHKFRLDRISIEDSDFGKCEDEIARELIERMISWHANDRPTIKVILKHPIFWDKSRQLQFFQEVSDRTERLSPNDPICHAIEKDSFAVIGADWTQNISRSLASDLRTHRTYQGSRIVDLIRAIRNKKHHFRELPPALRQELGNGSPDQYISYFLDRYPRLLPHVYNAMKCVAGEDNFKSFYCKSEHNLSPPQRVEHPRAWEPRPAGDGPNVSNWRARSRPPAAADARPATPTAEPAGPDEVGRAAVRALSAASEDEDWRATRGDAGVGQAEAAADLATAAAADSAMDETAEHLAADSDDEATEAIDIGRSTRRNRCRVRKKKKKKRKGPAPAGGQGGTARGEERESDEEEEDAEEDD